MTSYLLAGGGTAGHVNPLLAVADHLRRREPDASIVIVGTAEGLEARLVPARGFELLAIPRLPLPRRLSGEAFAFPQRYSRAVRTVRGWIAERGVDVVFGVGGYASAPAYTAAHRSRVPLVVHEANSIPGWANRLGARYAAAVGVAFAGTPLRGAVHVGLPLRPEIERLAPPGRRMLARPEALELLGLHPARPVLLVTGGSSGSARINAALLDGLDAILEAGWQVLHAAGALREAIAVERDGYHPVAYLDRMDLAYAAADFAIGRAGTGTVLELAALGVPAAFVPLPIGNGEQSLNARGPVAAGGAVAIDDAAFDGATIARLVVPILADRARVAAMAEAMRGVGVADGTERALALIDRAVGRS